MGSGFWVVSVPNKLLDERVFFGGTDAMDGVRSGGGGGSVCAQRLVSPSLESGNSNGGDGGEKEGHDDLESE